MLRSLLECERLIHSSDEELPFSSLGGVVSSPDAFDAAHELMGAKVKVWWPDFKEHYEGKVKDVAEYPEGSGLFVYYVDYTKPKGKPDRQWHGLTKGEYQANPLTLSYELVEKGVRVPL